MFEFYLHFKNKNVKSSDDMSFRPVDLRVSGV